jgi:hypothetical protein
MVPIRAQINFKKPKKIPSGTGRGWNAGTGMTGKVA